MKSTDSTSPIGTVIASDADSTYVSTIPTTQATSGDGSVSLELGFPPECAISVAAGGKRPEMKDVNGVWKLLSSAIQSLQAYRGVYDADFATAIGGYPNHAVISDSSGVLWVSTADSNTTVPGATDASWTQLLDGLASETWVSDNYVGKATGNNDYSPYQAGIQKASGEIWLSYVNSAGTTVYVYAQPAGDYALQTALTAEITRATTVESNLQSSKVNRSGDTMTGALTISQHSGSDTSGQLRWGGYLNSTITGATWNSLQLYMCELVEQYAYADLQVNYHDGSGNVARADFLFRCDTGRIHAPAGIMAVKSDLPTSGTITGGTYTKVPMNDGTGRSVLTQSFLVDVTNGQVVDFPMAYESGTRPTVSFAYHDGADDGSFHNSAWANINQLTNTSVTLGLRNLGGNNVTGDSTGFICITAQGIVTS